MQRDLKIYSVPSSSTSESINNYDESNNEYSTYSTVIKNTINNNSDLDNSYSSYDNNTVHPIRVKSYSSGNIIKSKSLEERLDEDIISEHIYINNNEDNYNVIHLSEINRKRQKINKVEFENSKTILQNNKFLHKMFPLVTDLDLILYFRNVNYNELIRIFRTFHTIEDIEETYINKVNIYNILKQLNDSHINKHVTFPDINMSSEKPNKQTKHKSSNLKKECVIDKESLDNNYKSVKKSKEDCCDSIIDKFCCCFNYC